MTTYNQMDRSALRTAAKNAGITGYSEWGVAALRTALVEKTGIAADQEVKQVFVKVTEPFAKTIVAREVQIPFGAPLNRHYNDNGSITLYAKGIKVFKTLSTEGENAEADEDYDGDEAVEKFAKKWFGPMAHKFGKTTYGHNWKSKKVEEPTPDAQ